MDNADVNQCLLVIYLLYLTGVAHTHTHTYTHTHTHTHTHTNTHELITAHD